MLRLNLGCSDAQHPDFLGVDIWTPPWATPENFKKADLRKRWPFEDSSVDEIRAHDIFEHLPSQVHTMNEAHRVLRHGGILDLFVRTNLARRVESANAYIANSHPGCRHDCIFVICDVCGQLTHIDDDRLTGALRSAAQAAGFADVRPVVEIRGRCDACRTRDETRAA